MGHSKTHKLLALFTSTCADLQLKFTRQRVWGPKSVFVALLLLTQARRRRDYRALLSTFVADTAHVLGWSRAPSLASLSKARRSLSVSNCRDVMRRLVERVSLHAPKRQCHASGRRFVGIDGTRFIVPRTKETLGKLDRPMAGAWLHSHYPQAMVIVAFDLFRRLPIDWALVAKGRHERSGAVKLIDSLSPGDVAVMDRGFPARWLLGLLTDHAIDIVVRMTVSEANAWPEVKLFLSSGQSDGVVQVTIGKGKEARLVPMRLIRRNFRPGRPRKGQKVQPLVILTTLPHSDGFDRDEILRLYSARWGIESVFREIKCEFDIERFHARSLLGIEQEIAAVLTWIALGSAIQHLAEVGLPDGRRVYRTLCFDSAARIMDACLRGDDPISLLDQAILAVQRFHYLPQQGRHYQRKRKAPYGRFCNVGK